MPSLPACAADCNSVCGYRSFRHKSSQSLWREKQIFGSANIFFFVRNQMRCFVKELLMLGLEFGQSYFVEKAGYVVFFTTNSS
mmetsp:Transcript_54834/g.65995  ORF Transcript_54834/g.65995 Transcript_54834/m.65995 type:complete len:83 (-) Transcript_54834:124-372(-)